MKGDRGAKNYASFADNHGYYEDYSKTSPFFYPFPVDLVRKRLNKTAIVEAILVPWAIFTAALYLLSFGMHYDHSNQCYFLLVCLALIGVGFAAKAAQHRAHAEETRHNPKWYAFLAAFCTIAWLLGVFLGEANYEGLSKQYYHLRDLNTVKNVDPASSAGQQFLDASSIVFTNTSHVDPKLGLGYKDSTVYCVAPITSGSAAFARYDFWAVGKDCCNAFGGSFYCGNSADDPEAHSGIRLMSDGDRAYYRLAVMQAESQYKISAPSPLFFEWVKDAEAEKNNYLYEAQAFFWTATVVALILHSILVTCTAMGYDKKLEQGQY